MKKKISGEGKQEKIFDNITIENDKQNENRANGLNSKIDSFYNLESIYNKNSTGLNNLSFEQDSTITKLESFNSNQSILQINSDNSTNNIQRQYQKFNDLYRLFLIAQLTNNNYLSNNTTYQDILNPILVCDNQNNDIENFKNQDNIKIYLDLTEFASHIKHQQTNYFSVLNSLNKVYFDLESQIKKYDCGFS